MRPFQITALALLALASPASAEEDWRKPITPQAVVAAEAKRIKDCRVSTTQRLYPGDSRKVVLTCLGQPDRTREWRTGAGTSEALAYDGRNQIILLENGHVTVIQSQ